MQNQADRLTGLTWEPSVNNGWSEEGHFPSAHFQPLWLKNWETNQLLFILFNQAPVETSVLLSKHWFPSRYYLYQFVCIWKRKLPLRTLFFQKAEQYFHSYQTTVLWAQSSLEDLNSACSGSGALTMYQTPSRMVPVRTWQHRQQRGETPIISTRPFAAPNRTFRLQTEYSQLQTAPSGSRQNVHSSRQNLQAPDRTFSSRENVHSSTPDLRERSAPVGFRHWARAARGQTARDHVTRFKQDQNQEWRHALLRESRSGRAAPLMQSELEDTKKYHI